MITVPRLPGLSPTAEACRANAVIYYYCSATAVVFAYRGSVPCNAVTFDYCIETAVVLGCCGIVPCECRDREQLCHDVPYRDFVPRTALENIKGI